MSDPAKKPTPPFATVLLGIAQVARGQADGLGKFGNTPQAVLAAITPLVAFMLVGGVLSLLGGKADGVTLMAMVAVGLLSPLVLSFEVARRWGRDAQWPRFAAAFCWCQWATPVVFGGMLVVMSVLMAARGWTATRRSDSGSRCCSATGSGCTGSSPATRWR